MAIDDVMTAKEIKGKYGIGLAEAEIIKNTLIQSVRQMSWIHMRGAYSTIIRDMMDLAESIHWITEAGTQQVATSEGCRQFGTCHNLMVNLLVKEWGLENMHPGDIIITNDAYRGGLHECDLNAFTPVFWEGKPVFIIGGGAHFLDMGGAVVGSLNLTAMTTYEEALRVPPMLLYAQGIPVRPTFNLLIENTRMPRYMLGDLRAISGALRVGEKRLQDIIKRWGLEAIRGGVEYTLDYCERLMRKAIREFPDGVYEAEDYLDDDGMELDKPVKLKCKVTIKGDRMEIDFSGSSRQPFSGLKTALIDGTRPILGVKLILDPYNNEINAGSMRPIDVIIPPGSVICALPPASVGLHMDPGERAINVVDEALSKAAPDKGVACGVGTCGGWVAGGPDMRPGKDFAMFVFAQLPTTGSGGCAKGDGLSFGSPVIGNMRDCIVEFLEQECPIMLLSREAPIDQAGAGKYRGGFSSCLTPHFLSPGIFGAGGDRCRFAPPGEFGGGSGSPSFCYRLTEPFPPTWRGVTPVKYTKPMYGVFDEKGRPDLENGIMGQGAEQPSGHFTNQPLEDGTTFRAYVPGGAGYGDPLERDVQAVRLDVWNEWYSISFAREAYGVIIDPETLKVDEKATQRKREELRKRRERGEWKVPVAMFRPWPLESLDEIKEA